MLDLSRKYFAAKINGNFPDNGARFGLPTIQGVIVLSDAENGMPLAIMDSRDVTSLRTAAATAVAAKYLARADSSTVTVCGCGQQGRVQTQGGCLRSAAAQRVCVRYSPWAGARFCTGTRLRTERRRNRRNQSAGCSPAKRYVRDVHSIAASSAGVEDVRAGTFVAAVGRRPSAQARTSSAVDGHSQDRLRCAGTMCGDG